MTKSNTRSAIESRRQMLKLGTCGAMTNATFLSTLIHLKSTSALMADAAVIQPTDGYKALVCLFFNGAIDSYNVLTPHGTTQADTKYAQYVTTRTGAALKRRDPAHSIDDGAWIGTNYGYLNPIYDSATGRTFGLHPRFTYLKQIYDAGHATLIANCGPLVQPIASNAEFARVDKIKPVGLFSHSDQQQHWQTAVPTSRNQVRGWAGRMADLMTDSGLAAAQSNVYTCISTAGHSLLLTGNRIHSYSVGAVTSPGPPSNGGSVFLTGYQSTSNAIDRIYSSVQSDFASQTYADLLESTIRDYRVNARDAAAAFQTSFVNTTLPGAPAFPFPTSALGSQLSAVARAIKLASSPTAVAPLKQDRQIFLVQVAGWDHHANLLNNQNTMIPSVDQGMKAFYDFLVAENLLNNVTMFSISDFARTWSFNGSGSDHAWGGNPIVMGGAVNGGRIYGTYPDIVFNTSSTGLDRGRGVIIPQTSSDVYHAEVCEWFGVPNNSHLQTVLPNIRTFYGAGGSHPIGFLNY